MKFRDPKTGEVFEDIEKVRTKFCTGKCSKCALNDYNSLLNCREYYSDNPAEAARLMGYEVVVPATGETQDGRQRICGWEADEICTNADCPMCADYCPVHNDPGVCRFDDREDNDMGKVDKPHICQVIGVEEFERICEAVHNGWWEEKKRQGVTDHPDMIPYGELAESVKEYDRETVRRVLDALGIQQAGCTEIEKGE